MTASMRIMILDDEPKLGKILVRVLTRAGHNAESCDNPLEALERLAAEPFDLLVSDLKMPQMDGLELMRRAREQTPGLDVIMMTAFATAETAVQAMKEGAFDYLIKPFPNEELAMVVARLAETRGLREENKLLKETLSETFRPQNMIAVSPAMHAVLRRVGKVAASDASVLLRGESGTGKEVLAMAIHAAGPRRERPLVKINCGALPETLLESELFGHTRGAFTGAVETRKGLFAQADGGTIFLDEIGEVTPALQVKLLRVLQSGEFQRVGDAQTFRVDTRVIAATNRPLEQMIERGEFRSDLYYRLNVVPIVIPPLRERAEDIPALIDHFLGRARKKTGRAITLSAAAFNLLRAYAWPGNIRELENAIEHACVMCDGGRVEPADLPVSVQNGAADAPAAGDASTVPERSPSPAPAPTPGQFPPAATPADSTPEAPLTLDELEKRALLEALEACAFNHTRAAAKLGITRRTLGYRMDKHGIPRKPGKQEAENDDER